MSLPIIILVILVGVVVWLVGEYNGFVSMRTRIGASVQEIGNQLKRQSELIPNLEQSVKGYLKHETGIIKMLSDARKLIAAGKDASGKVTDILSKLQVVVESNPQIKGADVVSRLMDELRDTSDKVMYSRRTMIDLSADYNIKLATFPGNVVGKTFGFKTEKGMQAPTEAETKTPKVSL